jgi:hypothetical protein
VNEATVRVAVRMSIAALWNFIARDVLALQEIRKLLAKKNLIFSLS